MSKRTLDEWLLKPNAKRPKLNASTSRDGDGTIPFHFYNKPPATRIAKERLIAAIKARLAIYNLLHKYTTELLDLDHVSGESYKTIQTTIMNSITALKFHSYIPPIRNMLTNHTLDDLASYHTVENIIKSSTKKIQEWFITSELLLMQLKLSFMSIRQVKQLLLNGKLPMERLDNHLYAKLRISLYQYSEVASLNHLENTYYVVPVKFARRLIQQQEVYADSVNAYVPEEYLKDTIFQWYKQRLNSIQPNTSTKHDKDVLLVVKQILYEYNVKEKEDLEIINLSSESEDETINQPTDSSIIILCSSGDEEEAPVHSVDDDDDIIYSSGDDGGFCSSRVNQILQEEDERRKDKVAIEEISSSFEEDVASSLKKIVIKEMSSCSSDTRHEDGIMLETIIPAAESNIIADVRQNENAQDNELDCNAEENDSDSSYSFKCYDSESIAAESDPEASAEPNVPVAASPANQAPLTLSEDDALFLSEFNFSDEDFPVDQPHVANSARTSSNNIRDSTATTSTTAEAIASCVPSDLLPTELCEEDRLFLSQYNFSDDEDFTSNRQLVDEENIPNPSVVVTDPQTTASTSSNANVPTAVSEVQPVTNEETDEHMIQRYRRERAKRYASRRMPADNIYINNVEQMARIIRNWFSRQSTRPSTASDNSFGRIFVVQHSSASINASTTMSNAVEPTVETSNSSMAIVLTDFDRSIMGRRSYEYAANNRTPWLPTTSNNATTQTAQDNSLNEMANQPTPDSVSIQAVPDNGTSQSAAAPPLDNEPYPSIQAVPDNGTSQSAAAPPLDNEPYLRTAHGGTTILPNPITTAWGAMTRSQRVAYRNEMWSAHARGRYIASRRLDTNDRIRTLWRSNNPNFLTNLRPPSYFRRRRFFGPVWHNVLRERDPALFRPAALLTNGDEVVTPEEVVGPPADIANIESETPEEVSTAVTSHLDLDTWRFEAPQSTTIPEAEEQIPLTTTDIQALNDQNLQQQQQQLSQIYKITRYRETRSLQERQTINYKFNATYKIGERDNLFVFQKTIGINLYLEEYQEKLQAAPPVKLMTSVCSRLDLYALLHKFEEQIESIDLCTEEDYSTVVESFLREITRHKMLRMFIPTIKNRLDIAADIYRDIDNLSFQYLQIVCANNFHYGRLFVKYEMALMRLKLSVISAAQSALILRQHDLPCVRVLESEFEGLRERLLTCSRTATTREELENVYYKAPIEYGLSLPYQISLANGLAYIPDTHIRQILLQNLRFTIETNLTFLSGAVSASDAAEISTKLIAERIGKSLPARLSYEPNVDRPLVLSKLNWAAWTRFPLCMRYMHQELCTKYHLQYKSRLQYMFFLRGTGMKVEDLTQYWRSQFTQKMSNASFNRKYVYSIKHAYGLVGRREPHEPYDCEKILELSDQRDRCCGCPFKNRDDAALTTTLKAVQCDDNTVELILRERGNEKYKRACGILHAKLRGDDVTAVEETQHPNVYYRSLCARRDLDF